MDRWENKAVDGAGIFYSRVIASWMRAHYGIGTDPDFREWLRTLKINGQPIPESVIDEIVFLKDNGKLELEESARRFIKEKEGK